MSIIAVLKFFKIAISEILKAQFVEWKNVVDNWDKLSEMLENRDKEMYSFMKTLGC